jgi:hypothetical protein
MNFRLAVLEACEKPKHSPTHPIPIIPVPEADDSIRGS